MGTGPAPQMRAKLVEISLVSVSRPENRAMWEINDIKAQPTYIRQANDSAIATKQHYFLFIYIYFTWLIALKAGGVNIFRDKFQQEEKILKAKIWKFFNFSKNNLTYKIL